MRSFGEEHILVVEEIRGEKMGVRNVTFILALLFAVAFGQGCDDNGGTDGDADADTDGDGDVAADGDADIDGDADADTDEEEDAEPDEDEDVEVDPFWETIDNAVWSRMRPLNIEGVTLGMSLEGHGTYVASYGIANVEEEIPVERDTVFRIASLMKTFVAVVVLQLVEEEVLALDDLLSTWLPDFTDAGDITLTHLLNHTSGVPDWDRDWYVANHGRDWTREELLDVIDENGVEREPGEGFEYSNPGYLLLGFVVERATDQLFQDVLHDRILDPLGMDRTFMDGFESFSEPVAHGYEWTGGANVRVSDEEKMTLSFTSGSMVSTGRDLLTWWTALHGGELLSPESYEAMHTPTTLNDGEAVEYGFGMVVAELGDLGPAYQHIGGNWGFGANQTYLPDIGLQLVYVQNAHGVNTNSILLSIIDAL